MSASKSKEVKSKELKINYTYPEDLKSFFTANSIVQHQKDHFILSFFETWPPVILGSPEEQLAQISSLNQIEAKCVARLILTPEKMNNLIKVLEENYVKFEEKQKEQL